MRKAHLDPFAGKLLLAGIHGQRLYVAEQKTLEVPRVHGDTEGPVRFLCQLLAHVYLGGERDDAGANVGPLERLDGVVDVVGVARVEAPYASCEDVLCCVWCAVLCDVLYDVLCCLCVLLYVA